MGPGCLPEKPEAERLKREGATRGANCKFFAGQAKTSQFSYGPSDPRKRTELESF